jgi:hypothetical protein
MYITLNIMGITASELDVKVKNHENAKICNISSKYLVLWKRNVGRI